MLHERSLREQHVAVLDVLRRDARRATDRAEVAHGLLDGPRRELGSLGEQRPLVGVLREQGDAARQLVARRVGAGHEHGLGQHDQLVGRAAGRRLPRRR